MRPTRPMPCVFRWLVMILMMTPFAPVIANQGSASPHVPRLNVTTVWTRHRLMQLSFLGNDISFQFETMCFKLSGSRQCNLDVFAVFWPAIDKRYVRLCPKLQRPFKTTTEAQAYRARDSTGKAVWVDMASCRPLCSFGIFRQYGCSMGNTLPRCSASEQQRIYSTLTGLQPWETRWESPFLLCAEDGQSCCARTASLCTEGKDFLQGTLSTSQWETKRDQSSGYHNDISSVVGACRRHPGKSGTSTLQTIVATSTARVAAVVSTTTTTATAYPFLGPTSSSTSPRTSLKSVPPHTTTTDQGSVTSGSTESREDDSATTDASGGLTDNYFLGEDKFQNPLLHGPIQGTSTTSTSTSMDGPRPPTLAVKDDENGNPDQSDMRNALLPEREELPYITLAPSLPKTTTMSAGTLDNAPSSGGTFTSTNDRTDASVTDDTPSSADKYGSPLSPPNDESGGILAGLSRATCEGLLLGMAVVVVLLMLSHFATLFYVVRRALKRRQQERSRLRRGPARLSRLSMVGRLSTRIGSRNHRNLHNPPSPSSIPMVPMVTLGAAHETHMPDTREGDDPQTDDTAFSSLAAPVNQTPEDPVSSPGIINSAFNPFYHDSPRAVVPMVDVMAATADVHSTPAPSSPRTGNMGPYGMGEPASDATRAAAAAGKTTHPILAPSSCFAPDEETSV